MTPPALVALDMDGTLTQHRTPLGPAGAAALDLLRGSCRLVLVGAGGCQRIIRQLGGYPIDVIGCYGMETARWDPQSGRHRPIERHPSPPLTAAERADVLATAARLRARHGFADYAGESVEFHDSGMLTFALLGTDAAIADKLAFDPDRVRRRAFHAEVCEAFPAHTVFVGGSSSFDIVPRPFDKLYALSRYCERTDVALDDVVFVGDDYGPGGNDEQVYRSGIRFVTTQDYRDFPAIAEGLLSEASAV